MNIPKILLGPITGFILGLLGSIAVYMSSNCFKDYVTVWQPFTIVCIIAALYNGYEKLNQNKNK